MRRPFLAVLGIGVLVALVGVAAVMRGAVACAAVAFPGSVPAAAAALPAAAVALPAAGPAQQSGRATFYGPAAPGGACSFPQPPADHLTAAAGPADYAQAAACGTYYDVTGPLGTVRVKVDNLCPECEPGHLDLSNEAFDQIGSPAAGIIPIQYHLVVDPPLTSGLTFRVKEGSSAYWLAILVDQHGNPLQSVEVAPAGSGAWKALTLAPYNYWLATSGAGSGPFDVRVTDTLGDVAVAHGITLSPGAVQVTSAQLYGAGAVAAGGSTASAPAGSTTAGSTAGSPAGSTPAESAPAGSAPAGSAPAGSSPAGSDGVAGTPSPSSAATVFGTGAVATPQQVALTSATRSTHFWC